jgi:hypothetical protein
LDYNERVSKTIVQAIVVAIVSSLLGVVVYNFALKQKINFRYTVGWLTLCLFGISSGIMGIFIEPLSRYIGITPAALIGLSAMLLLVLLAVQLSVSISGLQIQNRRLAEQLAILGRDNKVVSRAIRSSAVELDNTNVLVIVPAYNEELNLGLVVKEILDSGYQVLVIDDGSIDNTRGVAIDSGVDLLSLPFNLGVGGALKAGFCRACELGFLAIVQVDADGQHQTSEIKNLIKEANETSAHIVVGSRFKSLTNELELGISRRFVIRILARSASKATGIRITDPTSGFRLINQPLLLEFSRNFPVNYLGDTYEALVSAGRAGYKVREVPAAMKNRVYGVSSASNVQAIKFVIKSILVAMVRLHVRIKPYSGNEVSNSY